jgi:beta-galactosidase/beta-glucuronidase
VPAAKPAHVPGILQEVFPAYHGVVWYWREFTPDWIPEWRGRCLLKFGAVSYLADVWVNGVHVGGHEGGETPFVIDITDVVHRGSSNRLAVRVLNPGNERIDGVILAETPHRNNTVDYIAGSGYDAGGIIEPVELIMTPAIRLDDLVVRPDWKTGKIDVQATVRNVSGKLAQARLHFAVAPASHGQVLLANFFEREVPAGDALITTELQVENHQLWDLSCPFLYRVTARVEAQGHDGFHEVSARCGFRDLRVIN